MWFCLWQYSIRNCKNRHGPLPVRTQHEKEDGTAGSRAVKIHSSSSSRSVRTAVSSVSCDPLSLFEVFSGRWASVRIKALLNNCLLYYVNCRTGNVQGQRVSLVQTSVGLRFSLTMLSMMPGPLLLRKSVHVWPSPGSSWSTACQSV